MPSFLKIILVSAMVQITIWIITKGFERSYWGQNAVEEMTRFWNRYCKHHQKDRKNNENS